MDWLYKIVAFVLAAFSALGINIAGGENYDVFTLDYGPKDAEIMDVFVPESAYSREFNGVILNIHGGSWTGGRKEERTIDQRWFAGKGYILATMDYTVYSGDPSVNGYTMLDEITQALYSIQKFSEEKGLNITKACLMGYSAGAHLAAWYSYSRPEESPIELVMTAYRVAPSDFSTEAWGGSGYGLASMLSGQTITPEMKADGRADKIVKAVSPVSYINENSLPTVCAYGGMDMIVPSGNAESTRKSLENSKIDYTYIIYPHSGHMLEFDPQCAVRFRNTVCSYLLKYFGY